MLRVPLSAVGHPQQRPRCRLTNIAASSRSRRAQPSRGVVVAATFGEGLAGSQQSVPGQGEPPERQGVDIAIVQALQVRDSAMSLYAVPFGTHLSFCGTRCSGVGQGGGSGLRVLWALVGDVSRWAARTKQLSQAKWPDRGRRARAPLTRGGPGCQLRIVWCRTAIILRSIHRLLTHALLRAHLLGLYCKTQERLAQAEILIMRKDLEEREQSLRYKVRRGLGTTAVAVGEVSAHVGESAAPCPSMQSIIEEMQSELERSRADMDKQREKQAQVEFSVSKKVRARARARASSSRGQDTPVGALRWAKWAQL